MFSFRVGWVSCGVGFVRGEERGDSVGDEVPPWLIDEARTQIREPPIGPRGPRTPTLPGATENVSPFTGDDYVVAIRIFGGIMVVQRKGALGEYLRARRNLVSPEDAGLPVDSKRRVTGLRRDEVAALAGISPEYYMRLEQGRDTRPSVQVVTALGRALQLDEFALHYLICLATAQAPRPISSGALPDSITVDLLDQWPNIPAKIIDPNRDIVASNPLARALIPSVFLSGRNLVLATFHPDVRAHYPDWDDLATQQVAALRYYSDPDDPRRQEIVAELSREHPEFRRRWARHEARPFGEHRLQATIEGVGVVDFNSQIFAIPNHFGYELAVMFPDAGSPAAAALAYLASRVNAPPPSGRNRVVRSST